MNNHILKSVELIGIVTNIEQKSDKIIFEIQDGTGFIRCVQYNESWISESYSPLLTLKDRMMIIGTLGCQWDEAQLTVTNICALDFLMCH